MKQTPASSGAQAATASEQKNSLHGIKLISVLAALLLTLLLEALDGTIVGTLLPRIAGSLQGLDRYTWAVTAYLLASVTMIPIVGKLSDQFGRRWFLISGIAIFLLGSMLAGTAYTMNQFIFFRVLQGLGAGIGISLANTVIGDIFLPAKRARWEGIFGSVYIISSLLGPALGGWFADHGPLLGALVTETTRWRWIFYLNIPPGVIALIALITCLPATISVRTVHMISQNVLRRIDVLGTLLTAAATICLLLGLTWGSSQLYAWNSLQVIGMLTSASILFLLFLVNEHFAIEPILPLDLFSNQVFAADAALSLLQGMIMLGLIVTVPLFLQGVQGLSATSTGAMITSLTVGVVIGAGLSSIVIAATQRYQLSTIIGTCLLITGIFQLTRMSATTNLLAEAIYLGLAGAGLGPLFVVLILSAQNTLPRTRLGVGTGAINYLNQIGQTMGAAFIGAVVNTTLASEIAGRLPANTVAQLSPGELKNVTSAQILVNPVYKDNVARVIQSDALNQALSSAPAGQSRAQIFAQTAHHTQLLLGQISDALKLSLADALSQAFLVMLIFCLIAFIVAFFLKDKPLQSSLAKADEEGVREDNQAISAGD